MKLRQWHCKNCRPKHKLANNSDSHLEKSDHRHGNNNMKLINADTNDARAKKNAVRVKWVRSHSARESEKGKGTGTGTPSETEIKGGKISTVARFCFYFIKISSIFFAIRHWLLVFFSSAFSVLFSLIFFSLLLDAIRFLFRTSFCVLLGAMNPGHPSTNKNINSFGTWIRFRNTDTLCAPFLLHLLLANGNGKKERAKHLHLFVSVCIALRFAGRSIYVHI